MTPTQPRPASTTTTTSPSNLSPGQLLNECFAYMRYANFPPDEITFLTALNDGQHRFGTRFRFTAGQVARLQELYTQRIVPLL